MKQDTMPDFMIIDDDPLHNVVCFKTIQSALPGSVIKAFTDPEKGLEYISSTYTGKNAVQVILFLDINMPCLSGWEVMDKLKSYTHIAKKRVKIFILSCSMNPKDKEKANNHSLVSGYIQKSLSSFKIKAIFPDLVKQGRI